MDEFIEYLDMLQEKEWFLWRMEFSKTTRVYLWNNYESVEDITRKARNLAFERDCNPRFKPKKREIELIDKLRAAGLIRDTADFLMSFHVGRLYSAVYKSPDGIFVTKIDDLTDAEYINFRGISEEELESVKVSLRYLLTEREYGVVYYYFGLDGGREPRSLRTVGEMLEPKASPGNVQQIEKRALRKLRQKNVLPTILDAPEKGTKEINSLIGKDYRRKTEVLRKIEFLKEIPVRYSEETIEALRPIECDSIRKLRLSTRAYNCLWRTGIVNISDILNRNDWSEVRGLGRNTIEEIEEKMHEIGYKDFSISIKEE